MPSPPPTNNQTQFNRLQFGTRALPVIVDKLPDLPKDVRERFPSLIKWENDLEAWRIAVNQALGGGGV